MTVPILCQPINCTQLPGHNPSPSLAKVVQAAIVGANQRDNDKFLPGGDESLQGRRLVRCKRGAVKQEVRERPDDCPDADYAMRLLHEYSL